MRYYAAMVAVVRCVQWLATGKEGTGSCCAAE